MLNLKISTNFKEFQFLKSPNLDIKGQYECVLSKYPESNAILITYNSIMLLDSKPDLILDEKKFNWFLNCTGFALRIDDLNSSQLSSQKSIFYTALELYLRWTIRNPIQHILNREKSEEYIQLFLIHISQIFFNPSFALIFPKFMKIMTDVFIDNHPSHSEETWATLIKVLLCGSCDYAISTKNENFTELSLLAFDILIESSFKDESFLKQFDPLIHKLFTFPLFWREVWLQIFDKVYKEIVESYFDLIVPFKNKNSKRSNKSSLQSVIADKSPENELNDQPKPTLEIREKIDTERIQAKKTKYHLIFEFIRDKIYQEFSKECKQEAFSKAINCWYKVSKKVKFPVHPKWPTDEIKSLFLDWFSIDCEWSNPPFHPLFTLIMRGEPEKTPELQRIAKNLIVNVLEKTTFDHETALFWYLPVYAYDFLMNNLSFLDSLELSFQNFAVRFEGSKMTQNFEIYQHLLFILIRLVQRTKSDDIRNTMTNLAVSSEYKNNMMLMITSILSMVVIRRGDLFWSQINKIFCNRYSSSIHTSMMKDAFSKIILIAGFVPLLVRNDFSFNINIDPNFWDLLESILNKNEGYNNNNFDSHFSSSSSHYIKSFFSTGNNLEPNFNHNQMMNQQQLNNQQFNQNQDLFNNEIKSQKTSHTNAIQNNYYKAQSDDFLKSIEQQKILLGLFCLSQGTDLFTSHPENNSRLLSLLSKPKINQNENLFHNSFSYQNKTMNNPSSFAKINSNLNDSSSSNNPNLLNTISTMSSNAISSLSLNAQSSLINSSNLNSNTSMIQHNNAINDENDDLENNDVSELKIFRKMTELSILCGGIAFRMDTLNNDMNGYTENFVTKKFILSVIGKSHIVIRHGLGINVFHIEDLGGRDCYKCGISQSEEKTLFKSDKPKNENETKKIKENKPKSDNFDKQDLYISPFDEEEDLLDAFKELDSMFNNNDNEDDNLYNFVKPPEKKDVSEAHSMLCDLGFISADSSMNTRHISTGCFGFLEKLDKTPPSSSVEILVYQLLDDNDSIIINRNKNKNQNQNETETISSSYQKKSQYSSLAYSLTNRGKRTKNLDELMKYLNAANDCCIATINYHMPTFDDEIENPDESNKCESSSSNNTIDKNTENENNEQNNEPNSNDSNQKECIISSEKKKKCSRRRGTIHSISPSQANQIGFLLLLNETGMVIDVTSKELNNFECVLALTPQKSDSEDDENYIVDLIASKSSFFSTQNMKSLRFYITRQNIGWVVSLAAFLFYATPGQTNEKGYTHMRSPSYFTSGYCQRSRQIRELFNRSESGRNTILVGCLSCGIKQS